MQGAINQAWIVDNILQTMQSPLWVDYWFLTDSPIKYERVAFAYALPIESNHLSNSSKWCSSLWKERYTSPSHVDSSHSRLEQGAPWRSSVMGHKQNRQPSFFSLQRASKCVSPPRLVDSVSGSSSARQTYEVQHVAHRGQYRRTKEACCCEGLLKVLFFDHFPSWSALFSVLVVAGSSSPRCTARCTYMAAPPRRSSRPAPIMFFYSVSKKTWASWGTMRHHEEGMLMSDRRWRTSSCTLSDGQYKSNNIMSCLFFSL